MKYLLIKDGKKLDSAIAALATMTIAFGENVQNLIISLFSHAAIHGDNQLARVNAMLLAVQGAGSSVALAQFCITYGGYTRETGEQEFTGWKGVEFIKSKFDEAKTKMWNARLVASKSPLGALDLNSTLASVIKRFQKAKAEGKREVSLDLSEAMIQQLINLGSFDTMLIHSDRVTVEAVEESANDSDDDEIEVDTSEAATG